MGAAPPARSLSPQPSEAPAPAPFRLRDTQGAMRKPGAYRWIEAIVIWLGARSSVTSEKDPNGSLTGAE